MTDPGWATVTPRKHVRHTWIQQVGADQFGFRLTGGYVCGVCDKVKDEAAARRSRNNNKRGRTIQRQRIVGLGGTNLAGNNENLDGISALFAFESKSGASFSNRYWSWLKGIPLRGEQVGVLIVTDTPGPGRKARSIVVIDYDDWKDLHGE
jgi:hypothetical protein